MHSENATSCIVLSIPRAGTHFLMKTLNLMGLKEYEPKNGIGIYNCHHMPNKGHYEYGGHFVVDMEPVILTRDAGIKGVFITRDLRDVIVSHAAFGIKDAQAQGKHPLYPIFDTGDMDQVISFLIEATPLRYWARVGWRSFPHVLSIKYEDLLLRPCPTVCHIGVHLNLPLSESELRDIVIKMRPGCGGEADNISQPYFRKGIMGDWTNWFTENHKDLFKTRAGKILIRDGYETGMDW